MVWTCKAELTSALSSTGGNFTKQEIDTVFLAADIDGDGALEKDEVAAVLKSSGESYTDVEVNAISSFGDVDGDGEITLDEFIALMSPSASSVVKRISNTFMEASQNKS